MNLIPNAILRAAALIAFIALAAAACGGDDNGGADDPNNVLTNAGFEDGTTGWSARVGDATVSSDEAHSGSNSALVNLTIDENSAASSAEFAYQEITPEEVPDFMSFDYYVGDWTPATDNQYIEAVVIVTGSGTSMPVCPPANNSCPNIQMRYVLAGVTSAPEEVINARWRFPDQAEPTTGEWLHFETDLHNDFTEDWGSLPQTIDSIRVQLEVRYNDKDPSETTGGADVYWDDVYLGPR